MMKKEMKANTGTPGDIQSEIYENTEEKVILTLIMKMKQ
jgi:hypothetical protein